MTPDNVIITEDLSMGLPWKIFLLALVIFGATLAGYLGLVLGYRPYLDLRIQSINNETKALAESVSVEEQKKLSQFYNQVGSLKTLLDNHVKLGKVMSFIEAKTNKKTYFENASWNAKNRTLTIEGVAESYRVLSEQLEAFSRAEEVEHYAMNQSNTTDNHVRFHAEIVFYNTVIK